ncbi:MAG: branched-chain amino acid transport system ATP-binding protein [Kribbellaceae bacterium]|jgi:branched-chain amino acid transport system ATP-binding protein|nr:branched-chain amino acid transport system ATP-binding protein [Kribbellaceae bacterium]
MTDALRIDAVTKKFVGLTALEDVTFAVEPGEVVALIGPNGAGKTTLFNVLAGRAKQTSGSVHLFGEDISGTSVRHRVRRGIVATFQIPRSWGNLTVAEALGVAARYGDPRASDVARRVATLCDRFELRPDVSTVDLGLHGLKKFELCRALAVDPRVILLDEVASGLDEEERVLIIATVRELAAEGKTVVLVEHSVPFVRAVSDRAVALSFGRVIGSGPVDDVLELPEVAAAYLGVRA